MASGSSRRVIVPHAVQAEQKFDMSIQCELWRYNKGDACRFVTGVGELCMRHTTERLRVQVRTSEIPNAGLGLFTLSPRRAGDFICMYLGRKVALERYNQRSDQRYGMEFPDDGRFVLDAKRTTDGFGRYLNHSEHEFNCVAISEDEYWRVWQGRGNPPYRSHDRMFIVAHRNLTVGAELLLNYGCGYDLRI
jgi:SET domain-containing protein